MDNHFYTKLKVTASQKIGEIHTHQKALRSYRNGMKAFSLKNIRNSRVTKQTPQE